MQEHTTKKDTESRRRGNPVRIAEARVAAVPEAVHWARMELARAEQSLYNLTGHLPPVASAGSPVPAMPYPSTYATPYPQWAWNQTPHAFAPWQGSAYTVPNRGVAPEHSLRMPPCDIADEGNEFVAQIELPGVHPDQVEVLAFDRTLIVQATPDSEVDVAALVQRERGAGLLLRRSIVLPAEIQPSATRARLRDGILTVSLPKVVPTEAPRRVEIQDET